MKRNEGDFNILQVEAVAKALGQLLNEVTFVGGASTSLLVPEAAYSGVRRTEDVDIIIDVISHPDYYKFCNNLRKLGFKEDVGGVIYRWFAPANYGKIKVDFMPTEAKILNFTNLWYKEAVEESEIYILPSGLEIKFVSAPYFLANEMKSMLNEEFLNILPGLLENPDEASSIETTLKLISRL